MFRKVIIATLTIFLILAGSLAFAENCPDLSGGTWHLSFNVVRYDYDMGTNNFYTSVWDGTIKDLTQTGQDNCMAYGKLNVATITTIKADMTSPDDPYAALMPFDFPFTMIMTPDSKSVSINLNSGTSHFIGTLNYDHATRSFTHMECDIHGQDLTGKATFTKTSSSPN